MFVEQGWIVEDLDEDYGEDLLVRLVENGITTEFAFYVQVKATESIQRHVGHDNRRLKYSIATDHLEHWQQYWEPVLFVVWAADEDVAYWETIQTPEVPLRPRTGAKSVRLSIPMDNLLDEEGIRRIVHRTKRRHERFEREEAGAAILLDLLQQALKVRIHYDPQAGMLIVERPDGGADVTLFGRASAMVEAMATSAGVSEEDIFHHSLSVSSQIWDALDNGYSLVVKSPDGHTVEQWDTFEELARHIDRRSEVDD